MTAISHIRAYMKRHGLSQKAFGSRVGVSQGMVFQWLTQQRPIGAKRAVKIEQGTDGELRREDLVPYLFRR